MSNHHDLLIAAAMAGGGAAVISNGSILNDDCASLTGWTDIDLANGVVSQVTYDGRSCFKLDGGTPYHANNRSGVQRTLSMPASGLLTLSLVVNCYSLGASTAAGSGAHQILLTYATSRVLVLIIWSDKITLRDSASVDQTIYTGTPSGWETLTVAIADVSAGAATICDVYKDSVLIANDANCGPSIALPLGQLTTQQLARETTPFVQRVVYEDKILVGNGLA